MDTPSDSQIFQKLSHITFEISHPIFRDHFPGNPLVPAFMQMTAVRKHAARLLECAPARVEVISIKFVRPLLPGIRASLRFQRSTKPEMLRFEILVHDDVITHGDFRLR
jgi:3-hydroxymyristoyl/3-hydroxydecanoyl-(acyl carrier protein) dehydratase